MSELGQQVRSLRGKRNYIEFARDTGVNRQTLKDLEDGKSVRLETLRKLAEACRLDEQAWSYLLVSWVRGELGKSDFNKLFVKPLYSPRSREARIDIDSLVEILFHRLSFRDQVEVLLAMARRDVIRCLKNINRMCSIREETNSVDSDLPAAIRKTLLAFEVDHLAPGSQSSRGRRTQMTLRRGPTRRSR